MKYKGFAIHAFIQTGEVNFTDSESKAAKFWTKTVGNFSSFLVLRIDENNNKEEELHSA